MVDWALDNVPPSGNPAILEVGSGNGTLLLAMHEASYPASRMCGIDYSPDAVKLAQSIATSRGDAASDITFSTCDFLSEEAPVPELIKKDVSEWEGWDLVLDKGTYDAIALGEKLSNGQSPAAGYPARLAELFRPGGYFLITCRSTYL
jgi:methylase of polypeptide subunit release factors